MIHGKGQSYQVTMKKVAQLQDKIEGWKVSLAMQSVFVLLQTREHTLCAQPLHDIILTPRNIGGFKCGGSVWDCCTYNISKIL